MSKETTTTGETALQKLTSRLSTLGEGLDDKQVKERLEEYIELKKLEKLLLKEIMKLVDAQDENAEYVSELESDLIELQGEADAEETEKIQKIVNKLNEK